MGQIFHACAYDIDTKTCCVMDADKFHANCYSFCGTVFSIHYLLRQKPYRVMWGGGYIVIDDNLEKVTRIENLLGISTYTDYEDFERNNSELQAKNYYDKVKFIDDNSKLWNRISVWNEAKEYFNWLSTFSVKHSGYLLNHTQKIAINLEDYYSKSKYLSGNGKYEAIDAIPVLTETEGGTGMALFDGVWAEATEEIACTWRGDLLQITDELPSDYTLINCCFVDVWKKASYCFYVFGTNEENYLISDTNGKLYEGAKLRMDGTRGAQCNIKAKLTEDEIVFTPV